MSRHCAVCGEVTAELGTDPYHKCADRELNEDLPAYLVYLILANVRRLGKINPDHILVKAVTNVLEETREDPEAPEQLSFNL